MKRKLKRMPGGLELIGTFGWSALFEVGYIVVGLLQIHTCRLIVSLRNNCRSVVAHKFRWKCCPVLEWSHGRTHSPLPVPNFHRCSREKICDSLRWFRRLRLLQGRSCSTLGQWAISEMDRPFQDIQLRPHNYISAQPSEPREK